MFYIYSVLTFISLSFFTKNAAACADILSISSGLLNKGNMSILFLSAFIFAGILIKRGLDIRDTHPKRALLMAFSSGVAILCPTIAYLAFRFDEIIFLNMFASNITIVTGYTAALLFSLSLYSFARYHFQKIAHDVEETETAKPIILYLLASIFIMCLAVLTLLMFSHFQQISC